VVSTGTLDLYGNQIITGGNVGSEIILSGQNFITGALRRASDIAGSPYFNHWLVDFDGITTGLGLSGDQSDTLTGKIPIDAQVNVNYIRLRNVLNETHPSGIYFKVTQGAPIISDIIFSTGIADGKTLGPTVHKISGNNLSGVTGLYLFPKFSGFNLEGATNFLKPRSVAYDVETNRSVSFSVPSGLSGVDISGYVSTVLQSEFGTGLSENSLFIKYPPTISGYGPAAGFMGDPIYITGSGYFEDTTRLYFSGMGGGYLGRKIFADISGIKGDPKNEFQVLTGIVPGLSSEARFKIVIENGVDTFVTDSSFGFVGAPEIQSIFPESGRHGDVIVVSGTNVADIVELKHGIVPITDYEELNPAIPTGFRFTIPSRYEYLAYDPLYRNTNQRLNLQTSAGFSRSSGNFLTIPDDIVCSGFTPSFEQRGNTIILSGGNISLTTGVMFTGSTTNTTTTLKIRNDGFYSQFQNTGLDFPKTGLVVRVPYDADNGKLWLIGQYSRCQTEEEFSVGGSASLEAVFPTSGVVGDTIELRGIDLHKNQFFFAGYSSGSIDPENPILELEGGSWELSAIPTIDPIKPLTTRYLTEEDGEQYVELDFPNSTRKNSSLYIARKELADPGPTEISTLGASIASLPMISGISTSTCRVGDTIYISGLNVWNTLDNAVMISGTGLMAPHDSQLRQIEFLSKYNTKLGESVDTEAGEVNDGRTWLGLGDHWVPNDPRVLYGRGDLDEGLGRKYNEQVRQHIFRSGINTPTFTDDDPLKTGLWKLPITIGDGFVGTGFVFIPFYEDDMVKAHRRLVEDGPDSVTIDAGTFNGRLFQTYDLNGNGVIDPFMWSGQTTGTDYSYAGPNSDSFYTTWTGSETARRFQDIVFKKFPLIIQPEEIDLTGFDPISGIAGGEVTLRGIGMANINKGYFYKNWSRFEKNDPSNGTPWC
jgi:hypothetical protein